MTPPAFKFAFTFIRLTSFHAEMMTQIASPLSD